MSVILRFDVDRAYPNAVYNHLRVFWNVFPSLDFLGYLDFVKKLLDDLNYRGIKASFFFRPSTLPKEDFAERILRDRHSVGLHAVRTQSFKDFSGELSKISKRFEGKVLGFSKHGSGRRLSRKHEASYNPRKYVQYAKRANLQYFLGNGEDPSEEETVINGVLFFPSAFWLNRNFREDKFTVDWLVEKSTHRDVVLLAHPCQILLEIERGGLIAREYEEIIDRVDDFKTIDEIVEGR
ncbi:hypothetical protein AKJ44_01460 [candidate division MSBL1 archaeon SCGC-AAA261F17]|uniref:NodB homology domain-containing protein n=1 Tax=candidate division MSBL1 archaeon SCGC-AAA261F17 TaxID=1698274 RepID=A0A133V6L2_9EURY|nr:hypothetical protein AKJ44_01460 [candidate division MSBL1 archaeon SCGC-AAA261F17]